MAERDITYPVAVSDDEGDARVDIIIGDATLFTPGLESSAPKSSPLKMLPTDGWANGNPDTGAAAEHDASAGGVPNFPTAKKRSICIVTVAGTFDGNPISKNDFLMALVDNPSSAAHWTPIRDSTTEFNAAVTAAQGSPVALYGTYLLKSANPTGAPINLTGEYTILNLCGYPAIYQQDNNNVASAQTTYAVASAGVGVATGLDVDDEIGTTLQQVSYFVLNSAGDAANFRLNQRVEVFTNAVHVAEDGSSKGYISNVFIVTSIDPVGGIIYGDRVIKYQTQIANASSIILAPLHENRATRIRRGALFMSAPTIIGGETGWWLTLDGSVFRAGTISGSGSSRTISYTGPNLEYLVNQGIRIGSVSGTPEASCTVTAFNYSGGVNTITISVSSTNDKGQAWTAPTSGTVYFNPVWWTSNFDTNSHGGALILQQAHGSKVNVETARLWSSGVRIRFTHYSQVINHVINVINIGTGISGKSWRLTYDVETYSACRNDIEVYSQGMGAGGRHPYTSSSGTTSVAWAAGHWVLRSGCTCENKVKTRTKGDTGAAADTHAMTNGDEIDSEVDFVTTYNTAHSYRGLGAQGRSENTIFRHKQRGGQVGLRIANGSDYAREAGSIDYTDLEVHDLPMRPGAHAFNGDGSGNTPRGLWMQSQAGYTGGTAGYRTMITGRLKFKNAALGFDFEANTKGRFASIEHADVGYAMGWIQTAASVYAEKCSGDYTLAGGVETTSSSSVALGTGSKSFTVGTGLTISPGQEVLVQDATSVANSKSTYGWGRVVSYDSGTGALVVYLEGIKGSGTITSWTVTIGAKVPRWGVVFSGTGQFTFGVMEVRLGEGANPTEIFHSRDNTSGKVVTGGVLIIDDPHLKGMPNIVTSGREADFTVQIAVIIYNGKVVNGIGTGVVGASFDGGGDVIPVGAKARVTVPFAGTIAKWYVAGDQSGSIAVDVNRSGSSIVGAGNKPTLSSAASGNAVPASWTSVAVAKGDIIEFEVDSVTTLEQANIVLEIQKS